MFALLMSRNSITSVYHTLLGFVQQLYIGQIVIDLRNLVVEHNVICTKPDLK